MANALVQFRTDEIHTERTKHSMPRTRDDMTAAELNAKLERSYMQSLAAEGRPYDEVFDALERSDR